MARSDPHRGAILETIERRVELAGRFDKVRRLGTAGGNGVFSLLLTANDRVSGKRVALKFFNPACRSDPYRWNSFVREPQLLSRFEGQPDVLQCVAKMAEFEEPFTSTFGITIQVPFAYYATELAVSDVASIIEKGGWDPRQKLLQFRAMCRAVQRVHRQHIAHRDIKPGNFLIMADGTLRLADFGTARAFGEPDAALLDAYNLPPGDVVYTAPEMFASLHDVDPRIALKADIYALGAVVFELFTRTQLNLFVLTADTVEALNRSMNAVDRGSRVRIYGEFVPSMADAYPLPSLGYFPDAAPKSILHLLDRLYMGMSAIDYRHRMCDFERIFLIVDRCLMILAHEAAYQRWKQRRDAIRRRSAEQCESALGTVAVEREVNK